MDPFRTTILLTIQYVVKPVPSILSMSGTNLKDYQDKIAEYTRELHNNSEASEAAFEIVKEGSEEMNKLLQNNSTP